jgi:hypothetical protein
MAGFGTQALPYEIKVIEGDLSVAILQTGQAPGTIVLEGRSGPGWGPSWEVSQRISTKFPPGNPIATQQAIGPTLGNHVISGLWNDRYLGDGQAMALRALFEQLTIRALSVQVTWGHGLSGDPDFPELTTDPIVRVGLIKRFTPKPDRVQDINWEIEFEWRSIGDPATNAITATAQVNPREGFSDVLNDLDLSTALWTAVENGPNLRVGLPQPILNAMANAFEAVDSSVSKIQTVAGAITSAVIIPAAAAQQLIAAAGNGIAALTLMISTVQRIDVLAVEVKDSALDIIRIKDDLFTVSAQCDAAIETCYDAQAGIAVNVEPDVIAEVRVPAGTDLRDLAAQYYGDADLWWLLSNFNGIDGSMVPYPPTGASDAPHYPIKIPRPQAGTSSDLRQAC